MKTAQAKLKNKNTALKTNRSINDPQFYGTAIVGTKGQIVIPKDLRSAGNLNTGDTVILFIGQGGTIAMLKSDQLNKILKSSQDIFKF